MKHNLKYFKKFLDDPASFPNRAFYRKIKKWAAYITDHENEFNYLKDEEWKEIRERVLAELERREDLREEFDEFQFQFDLYEQMTVESRIAMHRRWLAFMQKNQFEYEFTDEQISGLEEKVNNFERADERVRAVQEKERELVEELSDDLFNYYERTGKRPVLTAHRLGKRFKGN